MPQDSTRRNDNARLFVSVNLDTVFFQDLQKELLPLHSGAKISPAKDFHLTLKFFGNVKRNRIPEISEMLSRIRFRQFSIDVIGVDMFSRREPFVIFAKLAESSDLLSIRADMDKIFVNDYARDKFIPHITLMRLKNVTHEEFCREKINDIVFGPHKIKVNKICLMESSLTSLGPIYTVIETYPAEKDD